MCRIHRSGGGLPRCYLTNDSGGMHVGLLRWACLPLAIFGPTDDIGTGPTGTSCQGSYAAVECSLASSANAPSITAA